MVGRVYTLGKIILKVSPTRLDRVFVPSRHADYLPRMERNIYTAGDSRSDAIIEVLLAPEQASFVDALLALGNDTRDERNPGDGRHALQGGLQAAVARRMRAELGR